MPHLVAFLLFLAAPRSRAEVAPKQAVLYSDFHHDRIEFATGSYILNLSPVTWVDAWKTCHENDSYLVVVNSREELTTVREVLVRAALPPAPKKDYFHVGVTDLFATGNWVTILGDKLPFTSFVWAKDEPTNQLDTCVTVSRDVMMHNVNCTGGAEVYPFVCEKKIKQQWPF